MKSAGAAPIARGELGMIAALLLVALVARAWSLGGARLDHFDEGVYAFSALAVSESPGQPLLYPGQERFSPPFYFGVAGLLSRALGLPSDQALLWVSALIGSLSVGAIWWIGRLWFGALAGAAAATLLALSQFHIALSRSALTDVPFAFWLLCALGALSFAVERGSARLAVFAGLLTGLAWNTKYHGWFAIVIAGLALVPYLWVLWRRGGNWTRPLAMWGVAAAVAGICYLPWAVYVQGRPGGYGGIAAYYLTMLRVDWFGNLWRHVEMQVYFEGPMTRASVLLALAAALALNRDGPSPRRLVAIVGMLVVAALVLGSAGTSLLLALAALPVLLRRPAPFHAWVLAAWIALWLIAAPVYHPYARLLLPLTIATFLATGLAISRLVLAASATAVPMGRLRLLPAVAAAAAVLMGSLGLPSVVDPWRPGRGLQSAAGEMTELIPPGERVFVIGEPPLAYYLHQTGRRAAERIEDMGVFDTLSTPVYVVTGVYSNRAPSLRNGLRRNAEQLLPLGTYAFDPSDVRILDDFTPRRARQYRQRRDSTFDLKLFRYDPPARDRLADLHR